MVDQLNAPILECQGLTKVFKDFWLRARVTAVDGLDLKVFPREVFGLLGPNGSGKSTTIKLVLGLLFPTRGRAAIFGKLPTDTAVKSRVGYLPEESYLYRFLNARETLDFYGRLFRLERRERRRRVDMLLEMTGLEAVQRRPVGEYSKGMQRRIGLAQALINDPDLLVLDEPTSGLDPLGTRQVKDLILRLRERGKTVLLSSHLLADVEDVCNRVAVLYGGKVRASGTVAELLTVSGSLVMETAPLKPQTLERIRQVLADEEHTFLRRVEAPRKKLETLFLEIVHRAEAEGAATSGALTGKHLAAFLAQETVMAPAPEPSGTRVIEQLVRAERPPTPAPAPVPAPPPRAPLPDAEIIEALLLPGVPEPWNPPAAAVPLAGPFAPQPTPALAPAAAVPPASFFAPPSPTPALAPAAAPPAAPPTAVPAPAPAPAGPALAEVDRALIEELLGKDPPK